jgi:hypothetical protein
MRSFLTAGHRLDQIAAEPVHAWFPASARRHIIGVHDAAMASFVRFDLRYELDPAT